MSKQGQADTEELPLLRVPETQQAGPHSATVRVELAGLSDRGKVRPNNEDHYLIIRFGRFLDTLFTNVPEGSLPVRAQEIGYGMAVADGMGGQAAGEVASRLALETLIRLILEIPDWVLLPDTFLSEEVKRRAAERWREIHATLTREAAANPELYQMGTTLTAAWSIATELFICHVGDSRAYLFRNGGLVPVTHDHTVAQVMADQGYIRQDEVARSRMRHMLTQTLGGGADSVTPQIDSHQLEDGDQLLLCTDGLTEMVDEPTIASVLASGEPADKLCQRLVDLALERGGKDNVTVVVARYRFPSADEGAP
jgi:protein phosphatase